MKTNDENEKVHGSHLYMEEVGTGLASRNKNIR